MQSSPGGKGFAILAVLVLGSVIGIAGVDLVLPAIPTLPGALGGSIADAQFVLASFAAGSGLGMLLFGHLGDRIDRRLLLVLSFFAYCLTSLACVAVPGIESLAALRFLQGAAGSAAAVFAPGFIRVLFDTPKAVRAIGVMGSIESLVPAFAPIVGAFLLQQSGWRASFFVLGALAFILTVATFALRGAFPPSLAAKGRGSYWVLLRKGSFLRYCVSHALILAALLTFVFGAPAVIVHSLKGSLTSFVIMQLVGVSAFILAANNSQRLVERIGVEKAIAMGSWLAVLGSLVMLACSFVIDVKPWQLVPLFIPICVGLGLRGPPGFFRAIIAADGDDARGSALVVLAIMGLSALGTAAVAPFIEKGMPALSLATAILASGSLLSLSLFPALEDK